MKLFVLKHPSPGVVSEAVEIHAGDEIPPLPWQEMTPSEYELWKAEQPQNTEPVAVPSSIPLLNLRLWLINEGIFDHVDATIRDELKWPSQKAWQEALARWEYIPDVRRDSEMVNTLGAALGMSKEAIDAAFIAAAKIE